jgi:hypothetical protein
MSQQSMDNLKAQMRQRINAKMTGPDGPKDGMREADYCRAAVNAMLDAGAEVLAEIRADHDSRNRSRYKTEVR